MRHRQRLLAQHVLAGARGGDGVLCVQFVGGADVHGVHGRVGEQGVDRADRCGNAMFGGVDGPASSITAHEGHDFVAGLHADRIDHPFASDRARTYQPSAES